MNPVAAFGRKILRRLGWDITRLEYSPAEDLVLARLIARVRPVAVLDVGANTGQYAGLVRQCGYDGLIVSFEATHEAHRELSAKASRDTNWVVAPLSAVGSRSGSVEIFVSANSMSSSVLPMKHIHEDAEPNSKYVSKQHVPIDTLDALARPLIPSSGPLYLKIDTQGYEREVLRGASELLPRIEAVQLELSLVQLYEGSPTFTEMVPLLIEMGFELYEMVPGFRDRRSGRLLQVDGFFMRSIASAG